MSQLLDALVSGTGPLAGVWEISAKILLSAILGGAVGAERERTGKWAGLRTHMSIAVGAALLADVSIKVGHDYGSVQGWDPGRIAAQIVSGLGFIGAGSIIQSRGAVHGLTTAAGLWVAGAIGLAVGAGYYGEGLVTTVALLLILVAFRPVARRLAGGRMQALVIRLKEKERLGELVRAIDEAGAKVEQIDVDEARGAGGARSVLVRFPGTAEDRRRLAAKLDELEWAEPEGQD